MGYKSFDGVTVFVLHATRCNRIVANCPFLLRFHIDSMPIWCLVNVASIEASIDYSALII